MFFAVSGNDKTSLSIIPRLVRTMPNSVNIAYSIEIDKCFPFLFLSRISLLFLFKTW
jgi:hypothetical protein